MRAERSIQLSHLHVVKGVGPLVEPGAYEQHPTTVVYIPSDVEWATLPKFLIW